jgi:hypothetical protein
MESIISSIIDIVNSTYDDKESNEELKSVFNFKDDELKEDNQ